jgi:hypothetical protein
MYFLPNPSESERPFSPLEELVLRALGRRGGGARNRTERIPMLCARDGTPLAEEVTGSKRPDIIGPGQLALGGGYGGGEGWGLGVKGRGVAYFLPQTCADIYHTMAFFKVCVLLIVPVGLKGQQFQNFEVTNEKKTYKGSFFVYNG